MKHGTLLLIFILVWMMVESGASYWGKQTSSPPPSPPPTTSTTCSTSTSTSTKFHLQDLFTVTIQLLHTIPTTRLHLTFYNTPDECLVSAVWKAGMATQVLTDQHLRYTLDHLTSYSNPAQHVLIGPITWIASIIKQAKYLYDTAKINARKTQWLWVVTDSFSSSSVSSNKSASTLTFLKARQEVEGVVFEGLQGLLLVPEKLRHEITTSDDEGVDGTAEVVMVVGKVEAPGDGGLTLGIGATWTHQQGLRILHTLWPQPSFNLRGRMLRINVLKKPTVFMFSENEGLGSAKGYAADVTRLIQRRLNFSDTLVPNTGFGAFSNGSWNGMVGDLSQGRADVSPMDFTPIWQRTLVIDFGLIYSTDNVVIISRAPRIFIRPLLLLQIFTPLVWVCMVVLVMGVGVMLGGLGNITHHTLLHGEQHTTTTNTKGVASYCLASFKIMVYQNSDWWPRRGGSRVVSGVLMLVAVVVGSLYRGSITAFLAIPSRSSPINSLEELLESRLVPAIRRLSSPYSFFLTENSGAIGERVREIMVVFSGTQMSKWSFINQVAEGTFGFIDTASSAIGRSGQYEKLGQPCLFHIGRNPVRMDLDAFAYPKNSPIKYQFDKVMQWLRSYGIIEYIKGQYYSQDCSTRLTSDGPADISLIQVQGAFYVLGVGLVAAITAFILELTLHYCCFSSQKSI
ncbi:hypothetical protein Pmani_004217 [Petrolisthes manimaculis]|uniref:Ionotropic glutamate receptor L-glutamate and glycine-binding domain-containing protein n=1 Tax=Petrolisthes manimaculis TaxID=1843537 RepID=A0AAE1QFB6_9EUCA|nr:hypothetical protein Pmani_004217 [Petrolisthes manimaculis]